MNSAQISVVTNRISMSAVVAETVCREGKCEVCASAEGIYEEGEGRMAVKLDCYLRPRRLAGKGRDNPRRLATPRRDGCCLGPSIGSVHGDEGSLRHLDEVCAKVDLVVFDINIWRAILAPPGTITIMMVDY
jgi:hypothetical protein